jgi:hypothetical protein
MLSEGHARQTWLFLHYLKLALACALLLAGVALAVQGVLFVRGATQAVSGLPVAVTAEIQDTRSALVQQVAITREDLIDQVAAARKDAFGQIAALRTDVMGQVAQIRTTADRRIGDTLGRVDVALGEVEEIRGDFKPILAHVNSITQHTDDATAILFRRDALPAQILGLTAATKVTMGEWAQLSRDAQRALPGFLDQGKSIAANVQLATFRFSSVADNVDRLTKPKWYDRVLGYTLNGAILQLRRAVREQPQRGAGAAASGTWRRGCAAPLLGLQAPPRLGR